MVNIRLSIQRFVSMSILSCILSAVLSCDATAKPGNTSYTYPPWKHTWGVVRATPFKLRLFVGSKTKFNNPQGIAVTRLDAWEDSSITGDDDEITVYGVNSGDNCIIYNRSMYSLGVYGLDKDHAKLDRPWGIAADKHGNVYVADRGNARIVRLFNSGNDLKYVGDVGGPGDQPGQFIDPCGVALDSRGNIYVTDAALGTVSVFDDNGNLLNSWHNLDGPDQIAVVDPGNRWSYYQNDAFAIVIDSLHQRVNKFSLDGELLGQVSGSLWGDAPPYLAFVTLDYHNQVLITDRDNSCIHKLDRELNYLTSFGENGSDDYQFDQPRGIAIYRRFGQIVVVERQGAQYYWVAVDVPKFDVEVKADSIWRDLYIDFYISEPAFLQMDILDSYGRFVTRLIKGRRYRAGVGHVAWGMKIPLVLPNREPYPNLPPEYSPGHELPAGDYIVRATFRATYSSREDFSRTVEDKFRLDWDD